MINWFSEGRRNATIMELLPVDNKEFYVYRQTNNRFISVPKVSHYFAGNELTTKRIEQRIGNNMMSLERMVTFNKQLIGFLSDKKDGLNTLYMVKYDTEIDPFDDARQVASYPLPKGWVNKGNFNILTSKNKHFLCIEYIIPGKREAFDRYGYTILDTTLRTVKSGEYEIPYSNKDASVDMRHLTDEGEYLIGISVYKNANRYLWKDYNALEKTLIVHVKPTEIKEYSLQMVDNLVFDYSINSSQNTIFVTGTYGLPKSVGAQGVFLQLIDLKQEKIIKEHFGMFPKEFLYQNLNENQIERMERREARGALSNDLVNYAIRSIHPLENNSLVVLAEQFYIYQQTNTDSRGVTQTNYHYYFNDLVAYKVDSLGNFNWIVRVPKEQHSINDYGYYSSTKGVVSGNKLLCFFNDNLNNYDDNGEFTKNNRSISFPVRKKSYAMALASIDLSDGSINRRVFNTFEESEGIIVVKLCQIDYQLKQIMFFAQGKHEKFGFLQF